MTDQAASPPVGVGPYRFADVVSGRSFSLVRTPDWHRQGVSNVPAGHLDVDVRITGDAAGNARSVLDDTADVFDWTDQIPASMLSEIERRASRRYLTRTAASTSVILLNASTAPFSSQPAREAVRAALDQVTLARLASGSLVPGCYVLPPDVFGHVQASCPYAGKTGDGDLARARALVGQSGMAGKHVVVWSERGSPAGRWMAYYAALLDRIGFHASVRYGSSAHDPQTGYVGLDQVLPNPVYFYDELVGAATQGKIDVPAVNTAVRALAAIPGSTISGVSGFWSQLDMHVTDKAYVAVLGYPSFPEFVSSRIDAPAVVFSPLVGIDWSSLRLK